VLASAVANAEKTNYNLDAGCTLMMQRFTPRARGRAAQIQPFSRLASSCAKWATMRRERIMGHKTRSAPADQPHLG
jgi:hypothetical protein